MFYTCNSLTSLNISGWDTSKVTNMSFMFDSCYSFISLDLSGFDTANVTNMRAMFQSCQHLIDLDISSWDTAKVTDTQGMFNSDLHLTDIYVSERWNMDAVTNSTDMFHSCESLPGYDSSVIDKTNAHYNTGGYLTYKAAPTTP